MKRIIRFCKPGLSLFAMAVFGCGNTDGIGTGYSPSSSEQRKIVRRESAV